MLLSSHLLGEIEQTATHIGIVNEGRLVLEGELSRLKAEVAPEIGLRVGDPARAARVLQDHGLTLSQDAEGLLARLRPGDDGDATTAAVNRALIEAGVPVFAIGPRARSLEGIYRSVSDGASSQTRTPETV